MTNTRLGRFDKWGYKNSFSKGELANELVKMNEDYDSLNQKYKMSKETIRKIEHFINCHATDFDDGRWYLELFEIELKELLSLCKEVD